MAVNLEIPTITIYPLALRLHTRFTQQHVNGTQIFPSEGEVYHLYDVATDFLSAHGYCQHTVATFAKNNGGNRHEANEFCGIPTLGLGVGALSYSSDIHYTSGNYLDNRSARIIADYLHTVDYGRLPLRSAIVLNKDEVCRRYLILRLLCEGVNRHEYQARFLEEIESRFDSEIEVLRRERYVDESGPKLALTQRGRRFSSLVARLLASERVKRLAEEYR